MIFLTIESPSIVTAQLLKLAEAGQVDTGGLTSIRARVKEFGGIQAVVESCERDTVQVG